MRTALLALLLLPLADGPTEVDVLRQQVVQLQRLNVALQAEVNRLGADGKRTVDRMREDDDRRRLDDLVRRIVEPNPDPAIREEAAVLAKRLARTMPDRVRWQTLLTTGALRDGLTRAEAESLLGPPTEDRAEHIGWYHNPENRHVAPYLHAKVTDAGLVGWTLTRR